MEEKACHYYYYFATDHINLGKYMRMGLEDNKGTFYVLNFMNVQFLCTQSLSPSVQLLPKHYTGARGRPCTRPRK